MSSKANNMQFVIINLEDYETPIRDLHNARVNLLGKLQKRNDPRMQGLFKTASKLSPVTEEVTMLAENIVKINWDYIRAY